MTWKKTRTAFKQAGWVLAAFILPYLALYALSYYAMYSIQTDIGVLNKTAWRIPFVVMVPVIPFVAQCVVQYHVGRAEKKARVAYDRMHKRCENSWNEIYFNLQSRYYLLTKYYHEMSTGAHHEKCAQELIDMIEEAGLGEQREAQAPVRGA
jgi:hypothetical protein